MTEETRIVSAQLKDALAHADATALHPVAVRELATKIIVALDFIAALIPDLRTPHPATAKKVRGARTVPREAVIAIVAMVESSLDLRNTGILDTERAREVLEHDYGFHILDERIERLRAQVRYTVEARWAEVTMEAMAVYHVAKRLAKDPRYADLAAHVATIRRHLGRTNTKKTKVPEPA